MLAFRILALLTMLFPLGPTYAQVISLDGEWQLAVDSLASYKAATVGSDARWRPVTVPLSWQAQCVDLRDYQGVAWYRKLLKAPLVKNDETLLLQFDAVDYIAEVYLNGKPVGTHEGGYTPFEFDVRRAVRPGTNELLMRVIDPVAAAGGTEGISYMNIPHGKQSWYVQTSGPWQSVRMAVVPVRRVLGMHVTAMPDGSISLDIRLSPVTGAAAKRRESIRARIVDPAGKEVLRMAETVRGGDRHISFSGRVASPQLWSPSTPLLYHAEVGIGRDVMFSDRFGFRSLETKDGLLLLNGEPFYMIGALDQDFYPETIYSTPSVEVLRDEMAKAKRLGLNTLRCHIKAPDPRYLAVADEVGLVIWYEIPNWDLFSPDAARRGEETLRQMLERDWNHPSLMVVSIINESWGIDLRDQPQRAWLKGAYNRVKQMAVGRLVVDNSACWGNFHLKTDINDYHTYAAIPENRHEFDRTVADLGTRPDWLFSKHGDAEPTGREPLVLSEFGNWGLPKLPSPPPWWLGRRFGDAEVALPLGYETRFREFQYDRIYGTYDRLAEESQRAQFDALKYEIEQLRLTPGIQGYVITEFTDINWESNGLLDMWRNFKVYGEQLGQIQQPDLVILRPQRYACWGGDTVSLQLWFSHYSPGTVHGAALHWTASSGERGSAPVPTAMRAEVTKLPPLRLTLPNVSDPQAVKVTCDIVDSAGRTLTSNNAELFVYPRPARPAVRLRLHDPFGSMAGLAPVVSPVHGQETPEEGDDAVIVSNVLDSTVIGVLREGKSVVCLADSNTRLPASFPARLVDRLSPWYDGNWASNFNWVRAESPLFRTMNQRNRLGFEAAGIRPSRVLADIPGACFDDCLAGMFVGWLHLNSAYIVQMRVGPGRLLVCTLGLADRAATDPFAATLFHRLVTYAQADNNLPRFEWVP